MEAALVEVERRLAATGAAGAWRAYLKIDEARERFDSSACSPADQRQLARDILHRLHARSSRTTRSSFCRSRPFAAWCEQLITRAAETPDLDRPARGDRAARARAGSGRTRPRPGRRATTSSAGRRRPGFGSWPRRSTPTTATPTSASPCRPSWSTGCSPGRSSSTSRSQDTILGAQRRAATARPTRGCGWCWCPIRSRWNIGLEANGRSRVQHVVEQGPGHVLSKRRGRCSAPASG